METLFQIDSHLFQIINGDLQNAFFDFVMPLWRSKYLWVPLYVFLIAFLLLNYGRRGGYLVLVVLLTIAIADTMSSRVLKKQIQRPRPCKEEVLRNKVHLLIPCGSGFSLPSSHATNHFAIAIFLIGTLGRRYRWIKLPLLLWALSIAFGQVYVGVHYPLDVIAGGLLGGLLGAFMAIWYRQNSWSL